MSAPRPQVFTREVDAAYLDTLFEEVGRACSEVAVRIRDRGAREARDGTVSLDAARGALDSGAAVQLRYRVDGDEWFDTLHPTGDGGARLIRCASPGGGGD